MKKLELDRECGRKRVLFFDVDFWFQKPINVEQWDAGTWFAVHDSGVHNPGIFPRQDCDQYGMDRSRYWNSGFFVCNFGIQSHRQVFQRARILLGQSKTGKIPKPHDVTDQSLLNLAAQQIPISFCPLPERFNFYLKSFEWGQTDFIPRHIIGLHAAGEPLKTKLKALKEQERVLCNCQTPMLPDAVAARYCKNYEL